MYPDSDRPQCQHRIVSLVTMFWRKLIVWMRPRKVVSVRHNSVTKYIQTSKLRRCRVLDTTRTVVCWSVTELEGRQKLSTIEKQILYYVVLFTYYDIWRVREQAPTEEMNNATCSRSTGNYPSMAFHSDYSHTSNFRIAKFPELHDPFVCTFCLNISPTSNTFLSSVRFVEISLLHLTRSFRLYVLLKYLSYI